MNSAGAKPKASLVGCVLAVVAMIALLYGSIAGAGYFLWGTGLNGAISVHRDPALMRSFESLTIYSSTISSAADELVISRSKWASARNGILAALAIVIVVSLALRRLLPRPMILLLFAVSAAAVAIATHLSSTRVVFRSSDRQVELHKLFSTTRVAFDDVTLTTSSGDVGGGRSGTRNTTAVWKAEDVLLIDRDGRIVARLLSLPFQTREFAETWRDELARRTGVKRSGE